MRQVRYEGRPAPYPLKAWDVDPMVALLGAAEPAGAVFDFCAGQGIIRFSDGRAEARGALADLLNYPSAPQKVIWNGLGQPVVGTGIRCNHDPATHCRSFSRSSSALGVKAFATDGAARYAAGDTVRATDAVNPERWMLGSVIAAAAGLLTVSVYAASSYFVSEDWHLAVALGVLIEERRTNLFTRSSFSNGLAGAPGATGLLSSVAFTGGISETGIAFGHDGVTTSTLYKAGAVSGQVTLSAFVRMDDGGAPAGGTATGAGADFALVITGADVTRNVVDCGGGLYRVWGTGAVVAGSLESSGIVKRANHSPRTFSVSGAQLEAGNYPSSYIPTEAAQVARPGDAIYIPASGMPHDPARGCLAVDFTPSPGTSEVVAFVLMSTSSYFYAALFSANGQNAVFDARNDNAYQVRVTAEKNRRRTRLAAVYELNNYRISFDGGPVAVDNEATIAANLDRYHFGAFGSPEAAALNGHIRLVKHLPRASVTDAELRAMLP